MMQPDSNKPTTQPMPRRAVYWKLFTSTFLLSAFTFGGGYVMIPLMRQKFVDRLHWLEEEEMLDIAAIAQSSPGAIAVNASILIGYRVAGLPGALLSILGTVLPPLLLLTVISFFYSAFQHNGAVRAVLWGMQAAVGAVIVDVVLSMAMELLRKKQILPILICLAAFAAVAVFGVNIMLVIVICGSIGALRSLYSAGRKEPKP